MTTAETTEALRLYGIPGSESLHRDLASAYESQVEPYADDLDRRPRVIEEWSVQPPGSQFRSAVDIVEWLIEDAADDAPEDYYDHLTHLPKDPEVIASAEAFREVLVGKADVAYWLADKRIAEHQITWDDQGQPLDCGKPMYVPAPAEASA